MLEGFKSFSLKDREGLCVEEERGFSGVGLRWRCPCVCGMLICSEIRLPGLDGFNV